MTTRHEYCDDEDDDDSDVADTNDNQTYRDGSNVVEVRNGSIPLVFRLGCEIVKQRPLAATGRTGRATLKEPRGRQVDKQVSTNTRRHVIIVLPSTHIIASSATAIYTVSHSHKTRKLSYRKDDRAMRHIDYVSALKIFASP